MVDGVKKYRFIEQYVCIKTHTKTNNDKITFEFEFLKEASASVCVSEHVTKAVLHGLELLQFGAVFSRVEGEEAPGSGDDGESGGRTPSGQVTPRKDRGTRKTV